MEIERKWLGNTVTKTLLSLGKPVYSETEYVTNILMHCIVTDSYALRFFDYLFSYYRLDLERDISGMQKTDIDYICDSIINPYLGKCNQYKCNREIYLRYRNSFCISK